MAALEERDDIVLRPFADAGTDVSAEIRCKPGIELGALQVGGVAAPRVQAASWPSRAK
jgi:hypothetical protein